MYRDSLLRLAYAYLKNHAEAEDVAQDVFVTYIKKTPVCETEAKRKAWLMQVTVNKCKNILGSAWKKRTVAMTDDLSYMPPANAHVIESVLALDEKYRVPIHLFYYEGYSIGEIAQMLGVKAATVGTWLARGRSLLKDIIGDDDDE
jgi:RNA polymerase sigma-70 factor (ECF subfamily)